MAHRPAVGPRELVGLVDEHVEGFLGLGDDEDLVLRGPELREVAAAGPVLQVSLDVVVVPSVGQDAPGDALALSDLDPVGEQHGVLLDGQAHYIFDGASAEFVRQRSKLAAKLDQLCQGLLRELLGVDSPELIHRHLADEVKLDRDAKLDREPEVCLSQQLHGRAIADDLDADRICVSKQRDDSGQRSFEPPPILLGEREL